MNENPLAQLSLEPQQINFLSQYNFDVETFTRLKFLLAQGEFPAKRNLLNADLVAPHQEALTPWPVDTDIESIGKIAIERGEVGVAILNGGMATRFGNIVKGTVEVLPGSSFLMLKIAALRHGAAQLPIFILNSFATAEATQRSVSASRRGQCDSLCR